jgi:hypothetical protein
MRLMKNSIFVVAILVTIFMPAVSGQAYDYQSPSDHYNQYSTNNINSSRSEYESKYSPKNISNPYSQYEVQYSPDKINSPYSQYKVQSSPVGISSQSPQQPHDYHVNMMSADGQGRGARDLGGATEAAQARSFLDTTQSSRGAPLFFYLLVLTFLAVGLTSVIIIGIFKK